MISCMIEELEGRCQLDKGGKDEGKQTRIHFSLILLQNREMISYLHTVKVKSNSRFPCIHKKEPIDFQLLNTLP
jgi:hypothetical protein